LSYLTSLIPLQPEALFKPELILAGEGSIRERGRSPLSKPLPIGYYHYRAFKRGVSPSFFSSPLSDRLDITIGTEKQVGEGD